MNYFRRRTDGLHDDLLAAGQPQPVEKIEAAIRATTTPEDLRHNDAWYAVEPDVLAALGVEYDEIFDVIAA